MDFPDVRVSGLCKGVGARATLKCHASVYPLFGAALPFDNPYNTPFINGARFFTPLSAGPKRGSLNVGA